MRVGLPLKRQQAELHVRVVISVCRYALELKVTFPQFLCTKAAMGRNEVMFRFVISRCVRYVTAGTLRHSAARDTRLITVRAARIYNKMLRSLMLAILRSFTYNEHLEELILKRVKYKIHINFISH